MNFFAKLIAATKPSPPAELPVPTSPPDTPKTWVICFGPTGKKIWIHLITYDAGRKTTPLVIDDAGSAHSMWKTLHPEKTVVISKLDDLLLWRFIKLVEGGKGVKKGVLVGYFVDPVVDEGKVSPNNPSIRNLTHAKKVFDQVQAYKIGEKLEINIELKWLVEKMDDSEKKIVVEVLRDNQ